MASSSNTSSVELWSTYIDFLQQLEDVYPRLQGEDHAALETEREAKARLVFERAIEHVGFTNLGSGGIWLKYIEFETVARNVSAVNLLCYMALETPLTNGREVLEGYLRILNLSTWFADIYERLAQDASDDKSQIPEKHRPKFRELARLMSEELQGKKDAFINHVNTVVFPAAEAKAQARLGFEESLGKAATTETKLAEWQRYIDYEI